MLFGPLPLACVQRAKSYEVVVVKFRGKAHEFDGNLVSHPQFHS